MLTIHYQAGLLLFSKKGDGHSVNTENDSDQRYTFRYTNNDSNSKPRHVRCMFCKQNDFTYKCNIMGYIRS